jgi:anti-anti-sigma regulatory factor
MLKIQRTSNGQVVFALSGRMDEEHIAELEILIKSEKRDRRIVLDLKDLTLAGRDVIGFLARCGTYKRSAIHSHASSFFICCCQPHARTSSWPPLSGTLE